ncbi:AIPR family protein, partial [bacterium]|nr:AIPR family protein [bacterium]
MKTVHTSSSSPKSFKLKFHNVRHISCPEDLENNRRIYTGHVPISAIIDLLTDEDVRDYLLEAEGKKRRRPTQVHKAIRDTLENYSDNFSVLNSGIVIVARNCEIDEKNKQLVLSRASIVNGAQTQGIIRDFIKSRNGDFLPIHVKFELIVTDDEELIAQISIARNFQDDVMTLSIAGRLGQLNELEESFKAKLPGSKLQKSETQLSKDYTKTERLLQVITALVPEELWPRSGEVNKVYTYSRKAQCLKEFREIYEKAHSRTHPEHRKFKKLYRFYL